MVDPKDETHVWVTMEGMQDGAVQMELDKATGLIFVMNDDGKTVDSYRWS